MNKLHLIMPMGGRGQRFFENGFITPKPLIEIHGKPFFYWAAASVVRTLNCQISCVVLEEHIREFSIDKKILSYFPDANIIVIPEVLRGAVLTCIKGAEGISDTLPVLFNDCDHMFGCDGLKTLSDGLDGALLTFDSASPAYSYAECDENGLVIRTAEKQVISHDAICGAYYFRNKDVFLKNAEVYLETCQYSEYFMSGVYNCMKQNGLKTGILKTDFHVSFGTPEEYKKAENCPEFEEFFS